MISIDASTLAPFKVVEGRVDEMPEHELWIRASDDVHRTASDMIAELVEDKKPFLDLACIGAGAVNQANKSIAVARERLAKKSLDIVCQQFFSTIKDDQDRNRTRMMIRLMLVRCVWA